MAENLKVESPKPKRNPKATDKDKNTKSTEANKSDKKGAGDSKSKDTKKSDHKGSTEKTKKVGKDDTMKSSGETTRKSVRQRCKTAKLDTKASSTPKKPEDEKSRPGNGVKGGKKRANDDDDPMLRDEKDLDETIQESGIINGFLLFGLVLFLNKY